MSEPRVILKKAEIKRVGERITKKELCNVYEFNYNYYMNCIAGRNAPSKKMIDSLTEYLNVPTQTVYAKVFLSREAEESFHDLLKIDSDELKSEIKDLKSKDMFNMSAEEENVLIQSTIAREEWERKFGKMFKAEEDSLTSEINAIKDKIRNTSDENTRDKLSIQLFEYESSMRELTRNRDTNRNNYIDDFLKRVTN
jgi:hypothetical protein